MENYKRVISFGSAELAPAGSEREAHPDKCKTDDHIPGSDIGDWIGGLGDIEGHNPSESN